MRFRFLFPLAFLILSLSVPIYATEVEAVPTDSPVPLIDDIGVPVDVSVVTEDISTYSLGPITADDTSGLKSVILSVLGDYDVIVGEYSYQNYNGSTNYLREMQPDYVWLVSAGIFALVLYCVFRLGGALLCRL